MVHSYSLSKRQAQICRIAAGLVLAIAILQVAALLYAMAAPNMGMRWNCDAAGCTAVDVPNFTLTTEQITKAGASPGDASGIAERLDRPAIRFAQAALTLAGRVPLAALLFCVSAALWHLSKRAADDLSNALPWLLRASVCTLLYALLPPLVEIGRVSLLLSAIGSQTVFLAELDVGALLTNLLLAAVAFTVTWAIAAGNRAQRDIAEIV